MFKEKYITDNEYIKPSQQQLESLKLKMLEYSKTQGINNAAPSDLITNDSSSKSKQIKKVLAPLGSIAACVLFILFINSLMNLNSAKKLDTANNTTSMDMGIQMEETEEASSPGDTEDLLKNKSNFKSNDTSIATFESAADSQSPFSFDPLQVKTISMEHIRKEESKQYIPNADTISRIIEHLNSLSLISTNDDTNIQEAERMIVLTLLDDQTDTIYIKENSLSYNNIWYSLAPSDLEQLDNLFAE